MYKIYLSFIQQKIKSNLDLYNLIADSRGNSNQRKLGLLLYDMIMARNFMKFLKISVMNNFNDFFS